jgi:hypothetical protein
MILGVDVGYDNTKDSQRHIFKTAYTRKDPLVSDSNKITIDGIDHWFGIGNPNTDIDKIEHPINEICFLSCIAMCGTNEYSIITGLPIIQCKEKKEKFRDTIMSYNGREIIYKGRQINYRIKQVEICPQGAIVACSTNGSTEDRNLIDIGSYTINVASLKYVNGTPRIVKTDTWYSGILTLYKNVIDEVNRRFDTTLEHRDAEKILSKGLCVDGEKQDIEFLKPIIREYLEPILSQYKANYDYRTVPTLLFGGGANLLYNAFVKSIKGTLLLPDPQFANANSYFQYGVQKFDKYIVQNSR